MMLIISIINHWKLLNTIIALELFKFSKGHEVNPAVTIAQDRGEEELVTSGTQKSQLLNRSALQFTFQNP